jgi:hypothetical protein
MHVMAAIFSMSLGCFLSGTQRQQRQQPKMQQERRFITSSNVCKLFKLITAEGQVPAKLSRAASGRIAYFNCTEPHCAN